MAKSGRELHSCHGRKEDDSIDKQRTHYFHRNAYGDSGQEQEYISDPIGSDAEPLGLFRIIED